MRLSNSHWTFSPTDLATFVRCAHAIKVRKQNRNGTLVQLAPPGKSIRAEMLARRGGEHEESYIASLKEQGKRIVEIDRKDPDAVAKTILAMREGADVIVQSALQGDDWFGYADLLERVEKPSSLGSWSYEAADTKLSMSVQPYFILQMGVYTQMLAGIQGVIPERMHLILGDGTRQTFPYSDFAAYLRHIDKRFRSHFESDIETLPYPVEYCAFCEWNRHCWKHLVQLDHLSLVAGIRRDHVKELERAGVTTLTLLGETLPHISERDIAAPILDRLHNQARLQLEQRRTGKHRYEFLEPQERRGFQLLPRESPGDVFFDVEFDPFEDLTYLFGISYEEAGEWKYRALWSLTPEEERVAFEQVVDFIVARRSQYPDAHIYHYSAADVSTLKKLMGRYGSREDEIDNLLRGDAFVDLLAVVKQSIRTSQPGYSLKKIETFYFNRESEGVIEAGGSIVAYEEWLDTHDPQKKQEIEDYNRDDCNSIVALRDWLIKLRADLEQERNIGLAWREPKAPDPTSEELEQERMETDELSRMLLAALPEGNSARSEEQHAQYVLAHLLHYHRREDRPVWGEFFRRLQMSPEELLDDKESIGALVPTGKTRFVGRSTATEFSFPPQQHKFESGDSVLNPHRVKDDGWPESAGTIETIDDAEGLIELKRGTVFTPETTPQSIVPGGAVNTAKIRAALQRFARSIVEGGFDATRFRAGRDILLRNLPRVKDHTSGAPLHGPHVDEETLVSLADRLSDSYLFIQGPPGAGKTYHGARIIVDLLRRGKRVGVTATSHKAIENLLHEIEKVASFKGQFFRGLKCSTDKSHAFRSRLSSPRIDDLLDKFDRGQKPDPTDREIALVAGTAWLFSRPELEQQFDYLVIDEAGQMSLADAIASSTAARNVILLGDPLQLAQVSKGTHPDGCGASVLEHLLGEFATIPPERGVFLEQTRRMHDDVCRFISEVVYDSRLHSHETCNARRVDAPCITGTGLRFHGLEHEGNAQRSTEEADWIANSIAAMLDGGSFKDTDGSRPLRSSDFLVVTPYNAQVSAIRLSLGRRGLTVPVGTVDKFQGQEAPVVFFSMATSSGEDIPRSLDFLFSRNRLNVAISRAQCLAVLVASPRLLDSDCRTVEQMQLVNATCRFLEMASST